MESKDTTSKVEEQGLKNVKSHYFIQKFFGYMSERKYLETIRYNKSIQKRINININNYKDYSEIYSSIEIEIIPKKNEYGKFINIDNNDYENYYHIYLNGDKKESKSRYINKEDKINKIILIIDYEIKSLKKLFFECRCIEKINFLKCNRKDILDMEDMFYNCKSLKEINFNNNFNTNNVTDMSYMFHECFKLEELYVNNFYTNSLTGVRCMFYGVSKQLKEKIKKANEKIKVEAFLW